MISTINNLSFTMFFRKNNIRLQDYKIVQIVFLVSGGYKYKRYLGSEPWTCHADYNVLFL